MHDRRKAPRIGVTWTCSLRRHVGGPIPGRTMDVGPEGMRILTIRPLSVDEVLDFEVSEGDKEISGTVRVMREAGHGTYGLRFESIPKSMRDELTAMCA
jgi:hypothetical protein